MFITPFKFIAAFVVPVFGISLTKSDTSYTIDTNNSGGFAVAISRDNCDITSIVFRDTQYQYQSAFSHIASGLGSNATPSYTTTDDTLIFTCTISDASFNLTQYYVFREGASNIYIATDTIDEPSVGELRMLGRLINLPNSYPEGIVSNTPSGTVLAEGDVWLVDGETRSKFYSSNRFIDDEVDCAADSDWAVHACFVKNVQSYEKSSGGPFQRDINVNEGADYNSLTFYMNSGHLQTEDLRQGFHGPYALTFTKSGPVTSAADIDMSFFEDLGLPNYVTRADRGYHNGSVSGVDFNNQIVVHWSNADYQSWAVVPESTSCFTSPPLPAGTYTINLYQAELLVAQGSVEVTAGTTIVQSIAATSDILESRTTIFQIGEYDGQPFEFKNGNNFLRMHPTDTRMDPWTYDTYVVGTNVVGDMPMALFAGTTNMSSQAISFETSAAITVNTTFRVASTLTIRGARPQLYVNDYECEDTGGETSISSKGLTHGAYRGFGKVWTCTIPAGTIVKGTNTATMEAISGQSGVDFLSPQVVFDAIELFY